MHPIRVDSFSFVIHVADEYDYLYRYAGVPLVFFAVLNDVDHSFAMQRGAPQRHLACLGEYLRKIDGK